MPRGATIIMPIDAALAAVMKQTVRIARKTGQNTHGEETFAAEFTSIPCRIDFTEKPMMMPTVTSGTRAGGSLLERVYITGVSIQFSDVVYTAPGVKLKMGDKITLSDGSIIQLQEVNHFVDENGADDHTELTA